MHCRACGYSGKNEEDFIETTDVLLDPDAEPEYMCVRCCLYEPERPEVKISYSYMVMP